MESKWNWWQRALGAVGAVAGVFLTIATTTPARQAASNLASYVEWTHSSFLTGLLSGPAADTWGRWIGISLILLTLTLWVIHRVRRRKSPNEAASYPLAVAVDLPKGRTLYPPDHLQDPLINPRQARQQWGEPKATFDAFAQYNEEQTLKWMRGPDFPKVAYDPKWGIRQFDGTLDSNVHVENITQQPIKNCQLFVYFRRDDETEETRVPISENFDIRRGDQTKLYRFVYFEAGATKNAAFFPVFTNEPSGWRETFPPFALPPGDYRLRVVAISETAAPGELKLRLTHTQGEWRIAET